MALYEITWHHLADATRNLLDNIKHKMEKHQKVSTILAVAKGGVIPAGIIHQHYPDAHLRIVECKRTKTPDGYKTIIKNPEVFIHLPEEPEILVVDEILDSGATFEAIQCYIPNAQYAAVFKRDGCSARYNYYGQTALKGDWLVFPWELEAGEDL